MCVQGCAAATSCPLGSPPGSTFQFIAWHICWGSAGDGNTPIVEFAVDSLKALQTQEARAQRAQLAKGRQGGYSRDLDLLAPFDFSCSIATWPGHICACAQVTSFCKSVCLLVQSPPALLETLRLSPGTGHHPYQTILNKACRNISLHLYLQIQGES